jgi:hypothetical protein
VRHSHSIKVVRPPIFRHGSGLSRTCVKCEGCDDWFISGKGFEADAQCDLNHRRTLKQIGGGASFEVSLDAALSEVRELMVSRHKKYGPGNILRHGEYGVIVRLGDKYERLDNNREDLADESVDDTVDDVIGYGVIMKMLRAGTWPGQEKLTTSKASK